MVFLRLHGPGDAPGLTEEDLVSWIEISGDAHPNAGGGNAFEQGLRKKRAGFLKDYWKTGQENDLELVLNCKDGQLAFFVNGVRALISPMKDGGFPEPPKRLVLFFRNVAGTKIEGVSFENLGPCDLLDITPVKRASRSHLESIPPPPPPPVKK